eukprot:COSAG04_NODE_1454_length_6656_cov_2.670581_1_plen_34_part_10
MQLPQPCQLDPLTPCSLSLPPPPPPPPRFLPGGG